MARHDNPNPAIVIPARQPQPDMVMMQLHSFHQFWNFYLPGEVFDAMMRAARHQAVRFELHVKEGRVEIIPRDSLVNWRSLFRQQGIDLDEIPSNDGKIYSIDGDVIPGLAWQEVRYS